MTENLMNELKSTNRKNIAAPDIRSALVTPFSGGHILLAMPFDGLRDQYASVVKTGLAPRSLLASGHLERTLGAMEKLILGPLARQR